MPNGSLGDLLHSSKRDLLDWPARLRIAMDAAEGLSYLHHDCVPPIFHRDVKSNNILLDEDFGARISDFGVAKIVETVNKDAKLMSSIAGSCGYIAPGMTCPLHACSFPFLPYQFLVVKLDHESPISDFMWYHLMCFLFWYAELVLVSSTRRIISCFASSAKHVRTQGFPYGVLCFLLISCKIVSPESVSLSCSFIMNTEHMLSCIIHNLVRRTS